MYNNPYAVLEVDSLSSEDEVDHDKVTESDVLSGYKVATRDRKIKILSKIRKNLKTFFKLVHPEDIEPPSLDTALTVVTS